MLESMKNNNIKFENLIENNYNKLYIKERIKLIEYIRKLCKKLKFGWATYYASVYFLDLMFLKKNITETNHLKIALSCLIIAGNIL
jgi:hypothetical protein